MTISSIINGDISYSLNISSINTEYVDIHIIAYSKRWTNFDASIEYRLHTEDAWKKNISISYSNCSVVDGNTLFNLSCSEYGSTNIVRWSYKNNKFVFGDDVQVRLNILPRIRNYGKNLNNHIVSELYGGHSSSLIHNSSIKCIGTNLNGQYICIDNTSVFIRNTIDGANIYKYSLLNNPVHGIQIDNGNYIVADNLNNRVVEIDETLSSIINTYTINSPCFVDHNAENGTTLIVNSLNGVIEVSLAHGVLIWSSTIALNNPSSATYACGNVNEIIVCDYGNNRVVIFDKVGGIKYIDKYYLCENKGFDCFFYKPYRAWKLHDGTIAISEKEGEIWTYGTIESSSSSSGL